MLSLLVSAVIAKNILGPRESGFFPVATANRGFLLVLRHRVLHIFDLLGHVHDFPLDHGWGSFTIVAPVDQANHHENDAGKHDSDRNTKPDPSEIGRIYMRWHSNSLLNRPGQLELRHGAVLRASEVVGCDDNHFDLVTLLNVEGSIFEHFSAENTRRLLLSALLSLERASFLLRISILQEHIVGDAIKATRRSPLQEKQVWLSIARLKQSTCWTIRLPAWSYHNLI